MVNLINLDIAGINFAIDYPDSFILQETDPVYQEFLKKVGSRRNTSDIEIHVTLDKIPNTSKMKKIFDSNRSWLMFTDKQKYFIKVRGPRMDKEPVWVAKINHNFNKVNVYCNEKFAVKNGDSYTVSNPIRYPLDQLLLMYNLADKQGVLIHAAGIGINGKGFIFAGRSGAGKSTLVRQFIDQKKFKLLSDDRIVIRTIDHAFSAFGTPWPGDAGIAMNNSVLLHGIFFIFHGAANQLREVSPQAALEYLLPVISVPWYDREMTDKILSFCEDLVENIPAYELYFKPGDEIVDFLARSVQL